MTQREAAEKMGVTPRWVRKLVRRMAKEGDAVGDLRVVIYGLRGRASNGKLSAETQRQALTILKKPDWHDFGPTSAAEQLAKRHQIHVGRETLRGWMIGAGCGRARRRRSRMCTFGGSGERGSANWCSGTPPIPIGSKAAAQCVIWCG
jgi:transposase